MLLGAFISLLIISGITTLIFAFLLWKRRSVPGAIACLFFMVATSLYSFAYLMEMLSNDMQTMLFWLRVEYLGIAATPGIWLVIAFQYSSNKNKMNKWLFLSLFIIPILTIVMNYTNEFHQLYYTSISISSTNYISFLQFQRGLFYWIHIAFFNISFVVAGLLYLMMYKRTVKTFRKQIRFMLIGSSVAFIVTGVYIADLTNGFDIVPISAFIMAVFFFFGMYKFKLFRINPVVIERLVHSFEDAVIIFDHENEILIHNEIASKIFPSLSTEVKTKVLDRVLIGETTIGELINENKNIKTEFILEIDYHKRYYDAALSMIYSYGSLIGKILILNDISDKKKIIEQLNEFAYKDGLTGIYNRRFLQTKIEIEIARSKRYQLPLSLIFIDIDNFKSINDEYGHHAGDHVLQGLVNICQTMLRDQDVFARYGGEEFIIMLPETTLEYAYEIAEEIRSLIENTKIVSENHNISFTSSFGVIQGVSDEDSTVEQFINRVDKALYKSKSRGKNTISKG